MVKDKQFYKQILALSLPAAFQSALSLLVVMADNVMVTRTGAYALSAVAQSNAITTFVTAGLNGLATGAVVLISQYWGKRDMKRIKTICSVAAAACLLFAVLCIIAVRLFPRPLLRLVINAGETQVIDLAMQYLPIVAFSYLPYALTAAMVGMLKGVEVVRVTLYAALLSLISNVIFNYILIFGHLGLPAMGVTGAAIATVIGQFCGMFLGFILNQTRNHELHLTLHPFFRPHGAVLTDILAVGIPSVVMQAISSVMNVLMNMILLGFGNVAVNVLGAYFKLQSFVFMPVFGLSNGLVAIVGYNYGAHLRERVYAAVRVALRMAIVIMAVGMLLFMTIPQVLLSLFEAEGAGDLTAVGCPALRVISLSFILAAVGITLGTVFQAVGKGVYSLINSLCRQLMVLLPAAWLLSRLGDLSAVWWSFPIAEVVSLAVCLLLYRRVDRTMLKTL